MTAHARRSVVLFVVVGVLALAVRPRAADIRWRLPSGGTFSSTASWTGGAVPGTGDNAHFGLTVPPPPFQLPDVKTYTVSFTDDQTVGALMIEDDVVTLNLNGHTLSRANALLSSLVGTVPGESGSLIITNGLVDGLNQGLVVGVDGGRGGLAVRSLGRLRTLFGSLGSGSGSSGGGTVSGAGSEWNTGASLIIGSFGGVGFLDVLNGGNVRSVTGVVGGSAGPNVATLSGVGSGWEVSGELKVGDSGQGTMNVTTGGYVVSGPSFIAPRVGLSVGTAVVGGFDGASAATWVVNGSLGIGANTALSGAGGTGTMEIQSGGEVTVTSNVVVGDGGALHLEGGKLSTRSIEFLGASTPFTWTSGALELNIFDGDLTVPANGSLRRRVTSLDLTGFITIRGDYDQQADGASLAINIGFPMSTSHDVVNVQGAATVGGNLNVTNLSSSIPSPETSLTILNAATGLTGSFANAPSGERLASIDGAVSFVIHYGIGSPFDANSVVLSGFKAVSGVPGDYNDDGFVDAADYTSWRDASGSSATLPNDSTPGTVDVADYLLWRDNYGQSLGATGQVAVPEPGALALLVPLAIGCGLGCRSHRR